MLYVTCSPAASDHSTAYFISHPIKHWCSAYPLGHRLELCETLSFHDYYVSFILNKMKGEKIQKKIKSHARAWIKWQKEPKIHFSNIHSSFWNTVMPKGFPIPFCSDPDSLKNWADKQPWVSCWIPMSQEMVRLTAYSWLCWPALSSSRGALPRLSQPLE